MPYGRLLTIYNCHSSHRGHQQIGVVEVLRTVQYQIIVFGIAGEGSMKPLHTLQPFPHLANTQST